MRTYETKEEKLEKLYKQFKGMAQYKSLTEIELRNMAEALLKEKEHIEEIDIESMFLKDEEKTLSTQILKKYLKDYSMETVSEKQDIRQLIYCEVLHVRLQEALNELQKDAHVIPDKLVKTLHENLEQIVSLKEKLKIKSGVKNETVKDGYGYLQMMMRKYKVWLQNNQATRHMMCPYCVKPIMMIIDPRAWIALKHPFFKDRILGNETLIKVYKEQRPLTVEDIRDILGVSNDYVTDFLMTKGWGLTLEQSKTSNKTEEVKNEKS